MGDPAVMLRRWTRAEFNRMVEEGIIGPDERVELLDGEVVAMTPQNRPHAAAIVLMQEALMRAFPPGAYSVQTQLPLALGGDTQPEPDFAVVVGSPRDYLDDHPSTALLVVEVANTSLPLDRQRKGPIYARSGIPEYWIVNVPERKLEVYREPVETSAGWGYRLVQLLNPSDVVKPLASEAPAIPVADLLP